MGASDIESALQTINGGITGVNTAPTQIPGSLERARLPMALVYPGPSEPSNVRSLTNINQDREWIIRLYVAIVGSGRGYDEGYHDALPFLSRFPATYNDNEGSGTHWWDLTYLGDSGVTTMGLHGSNVEPICWTIEFRVFVRTEES